MKLGSLKSGRDGRLVVVSQDLAWCADAGHIARTLQAALDDWAHAAPQLENLAVDLSHQVIPMDRFHERAAAAPLPRAFGHAVAKAGDGIALAASGAFPAPRDATGPADDARPGVAVITGDVPRGATREEALAAIRLVGLSTHMDGETSFSPVFATPEELGARWGDGRLRGDIRVEADGALRFAVDAADTPDFGELITQIAATRALPAGSVITSGPIGPAPAPLAAGETLKIAVLDEHHHPVFGMIEHVAEA